MAQLFDAPTYLRANPDVAEAVGEGTVASAWRHYVQSGHGEGRPGVPEAVRRKVGAVMAASARIPPAGLIARVYGAGDAAGFEQAGRTVALDVFSAVNDRISLERPLRILDFGCGCARVLRFMGELAPESTFQASDVDGEAVSWCTESYPFEVRRGRYTFTVNADWPPTPFKSDHFDLVLGISVFTRLPEARQLAWLAELRRVARPDGLLVLSTQGDALVRRHVGAEDNGILDRHGFLHLGRDGHGGLPEGSQAAWHTRAYIDRVWSRYFHIAAHVPAGIADRQDLVLCAKRRPLVI
jgi:SAM-dependent methyltransferase